jgi:hypothetical protein
MKYKSTMIALMGVALSGAFAFGAGPARPGTVNYVEGAAYLSGQPLNNKDVGNSTLEAGQVLDTATGKAEILLTPGVFLRIGDNSAVKMVSPGLTLTQVDLEKGRAGIEVDELHNQNDLQVIDNGVTTRIDKTGYYEFDSNPAEAMVFKGMAKAEVGDGKWREIKSHHELALNGSANGQPLATEKPVDFNTQTPDDLYNWSSLRSHYLAEANNEMAGEYGPAGYYPGWYWDPYMFDYTFIGAGPFYSPFGWGYYPFGWGGFYSGWGGGWYGGGPGYHGRYYRYGGARGVNGGGFHGTDGFHGGGMGGFHGGGGGFHGGGGGHR